MASGRYVLIAARLLFYSPPSWLMSRLPPALLYLTIYNPTIRPTAAVSEDDEDAEEQAQILFYTAREHAASRDKMLRQVGLAKALINFSELRSMFSGDVCENIHSQSRRMVMLSPEPGFWIHAVRIMLLTRVKCVELGKTWRQASQNKPKGKDKAKEKIKTKDKATTKEVPEHLCDYHDGCVSDTALRSHLLGGYERFKVAHGSFTSILHNIGQQALELQLERFFTPWAWNWDIDQDCEFSSYLGISLHPQHKSLSKHLDGLSQETLQNLTAPFILTPSHIIPSSSYTSTHISWAIPQYLRSRVPPPRPPSITINPPPEVLSSASAETLKAGTDGIAEGAKDALNATGNAFLAIGASMDVRKWSWPGYLTFGKNAGRQFGSHNAEEPNGDDSEPASKHEVASDGTPDQLSEIKVDAESLHEAMSSFGVGVAVVPSGSNEESSEHLFNAQDLLGNPEIQEVFSRTQGPQHWHIARRERTGEVYMEVARKETSLSDVDNEVVGLLRRFRDVFV
ncbi:hypothetical protein OF83DRAFT_1087486 [Amylostereum chailletii]|nr:hypothetical protein OF83DRAFT_1087486 [Amylostereum chailletii]